MRLDFGEETRLASMEMEGHPTADLVEELERRGTLRIDGDSSGPDADAIKFLVERAGDIPGFWLFVPHVAYATGVDELPT